jgi:hypothetical protein
MPVLRSKQGRVPVLGLIRQRCYQTAVGMGDRRSLSRSRSCCRVPGCGGYVATRDDWNGGMLPDEAGSMRAVVWLDGSCKSETWPCIWSHMDAARNWAEPSMHHDHRRRLPQPCAGALLARGLHLQPSLRCACSCVDSIPFVYQRRSFIVPSASGIRLHLYIAGTSTSASSPHQPHHHGDQPSATVPPSRPHQALLA